MPKKKIKEDISPQQKLRNRILKAQKKLAREQKAIAKPKPKVKKKTYSDKSILKRAGSRLKRLFSRKKKKLKTARTSHVEKGLKKAGITKKQVSKLRDKY